MDGCLTTVREKERERLVLVHFAIQDENERVKEKGKDGKEGWEGGDVSLFCSLFTNDNVWECEWFFFITCWWDLLWDGWDVCGQGYHFIFISISFISWAGLFCRPLCMAHDGVLNRVGFISTKEQNIMVAQQQYGKKRKKNGSPFHPFCPAVPCPLPCPLPCPALCPPFPSLSFSSLSLSLPYLFFFTYVICPILVHPILPPSQRYALTRSLCALHRKTTEWDEKSCPPLFGRSLFFYLPCVFHLKCGLLERAMLHCLGWKILDQSTPFTLDCLWCERRRGSERRTWMSTSWGPTKERPNALRLRYTPESNFLYFPCFPCLSSHDHSFVWGRADFCWASTLWRTAYSTIGGRGPPGATPLSTPLPQRILADTRPLSQGDKRSCPRSTHSGQRPSRQSSKRQRQALLARPPASDKVKANPQCKSNRFTVPRNSSAGARKRMHWPRCPYR